MLHDVVEHILLFFRLLIIGFILKTTFKLDIKLVYALFIYGTLITYKIFCLSIKSIQIILTLCRKTLVLER